MVYNPTYLSDNKTLGQDYTTPTSKNEGEQIERKCKKHPRHDSGSKPSDRHDGITSKSLARALDHITAQLPEKQSKGSDTLLSGEGKGWPEELGEATIIKTWLRGGKSCQMILHQVGLETKPLSGFKIMGVIPSGRVNPKKSQRLATFTLPREYWNWVKPNGNTIPTEYSTKSLTSSLTQWEKVR